MLGKLWSSSLCIVLSIFCSGSLLANPTDTFRLANESLSEGAIRDAIHLYESLVDQGFSSVALDYNLGTAHAQTKDWVKARLYLERAQHKAPLNEEIAQNIALVRDEIGEYYSFPKYPLDSIIGWIRTHLGSYFLPIVQLMLFGALLAFLYLWRNKPSASLKRIVILSACLMLLVLPLTIAQQLDDRRFQKMVLLIQDYELKLQPETASSAVETLPAGTKLMVQEKFGGWWQVETATGEEGWIQAEMAALL